MHQVTTKVHEEHLYASDHTPISINFSNTNNKTNLVRLDYKALDVFSDIKKLEENDNYLEKLTPLKLAEEVNEILKSCIFIKNINSKRRKPWFLAEIKNLRRSMLTILHLYKNSTIEQEKSSYFKIYAETRTTYHRCIKEAKDISEKQKVEHISTLSYIEALKQIYKTFKGSKSPDIVDSNTFWVYCKNLYKSDVAHEKPVPTGWKIIIHTHY